MREYLDADFVANLVSMLRADIDGAIWLADDLQEARFYERCAHFTARVCAAPGSAIEVLSLIEDRGIEGVVASVHGVETPACSRDNVFRPSVGDVASLLLISRTFREVVTEICGAPWLNACEKEIGPVLIRVVWISRVIAKLNAAYSDLNRLYDLGVVVQWETFEPAWNSLHSILSSVGLAGSVLEEARAISCQDDINKAILECDGMDAVSVLAAATRFFRPRGISSSKQIQPGDLMAMLRVSFDLGDLEADGIFWRMRRWERRNPRYPLLRAWRILDPLGVVCDQRYWERDLTCMLRLLVAGERLAAFKMDLDNFARVNEVLGHSLGDEAIRLYCSIVKRVLGNVGEVYRRGGDEVVAFVTGLDAAVVRTLAEEVRATVATEFTSWAEDRGLEPALTASIGVVLSENSRPVDEIVQAMDDSQRQAKEQGKNCVIFLQL